MSKRLTAKDYKKQLEAVSKEKEALETRIVKRAKDLCKKYPDIVVAETTPNKGYIYTGVYSNIENLHVLTALSLIQIVEEELANRHPHKQTRIEGF